MLIEKDLIKHPIRQKIGYIANKEIVVKIEEDNDMVDTQTKEVKLQFCKYGHEHIFKFREILSSKERL
jgi:hypothetical protein